LKSNRQHTDTELWQAFKSGDRLAFETIYRKYFHDLRHYGMSLCHEQEHVLDAIHTLFFDLWTSKDNLGDTNNIKYYLLKALRRVITHQLVKQRNQSTPTAREEGFDISIEARLIEKQGQEETTQKLSKAIAQLPARQREVVFLKFYENLSYEEIASMTSLKTRTVYNTLFTALERMRKVITKQVNWSILLILNFWL